MRLDGTISNIIRAIEFAAKKHHGQTRKYTGEPYIVHCLSVARILADHGCEEPCISVAILHDTLEDTQTDFHELEEHFGTVIAKLVVELTDPPLSEGNREKRKAISRERLASASYYSKTVKCADLIDNMHSIVLNDKHFGKVFMDEVGLLIPLLDNSHQTLYRELVGEYEHCKEIIECRNT